MRRRQCAVVTAHLRYKLLKLNETTGLQVAKYSAEKGRAVVDGPKGETHVNEIKSVWRKCPLVFKVIDRKAEIGWHVGWLDGRKIDAPDDGAGVPFGNC